MTKKSSVKRGKQIFEELSLIIRQLSDVELIELFSNSELDDWLKSILDSSERSNYANLNEFLLANKVRASLIAGLRHAITHNYSLRGITNDGKSCFISPSHIQWFDDGVMFLQGKKPFQGLVGLYRKDKSLSYAILARDARAGEIMGPEYFEFIDEADFPEHLARLPVNEISKLDEPVQQIEASLRSNDNDESHYQELLTKHPWLLGAEYKAIQRHTKLDDKNIADFTGVRVRDGCRDIIEIKPPFTKMFRSNGQLNNNFNDAWNQTERYLHFAQSEQDYLHSKGFLFDNPKCYLILGFNLTDEELRQVRLKESLYPAINLLTYNDLLAFAESTVALIRELKALESEGEGQEE